MTATTRGTTRLALAACVAAWMATVGCGKFQDPNVVVDLRVIAMAADVPEQVIDIDLVNPPPAATLLDQLVPARVCALVADPNFDRRLRWSMTLCAATGNDRCAGDHPHVVIGSGLLADPELAVPEPQLCATIQPDGNLVSVVLDALDGDQLHGLQGVDYEVLLQVGGEDADPALDQYAAKTLQVAARVPANRTANTNPSVTAIAAALNGSTQGVPLAYGRCGVDQQTPLGVAPGDKVTLDPVEPDGVRETYVIPTLDGMTATFTESITYQWIASNGGFSDGTTGGPRDAFGNPPSLDSTWSAPSAGELAGPTDVSIWMVQRDERLGVHWYETCIRVSP